ncbi:MAG: phosphopantetheine-binding protein, partial [Actinoallomurus sp.]
ENQERPGPAVDGATTAHPRPLLATAFVPPRDEREEHVAAVWRDLLGIAEIGVHDNFFELGGHSLLATKITVRLGDLLGVELGLGALMDAPTIAGLCAHVNDLAGARADDDLLAELLGELEGADEERVSAYLDEQLAANGRAPAPNSAPSRSPSPDSRRH